MGPNGSRRLLSLPHTRQALGALIIQSRTQLSDRKLVKEIARDVSYQYFIGLQTFQVKCPFRHGVVPEFRKRLGKDFLVKVNEIILKGAKPTPAHADDKEEKPAANGNLGTMILDATRSSSNVRFPQDFSLLNEAREKLDKMIDLLVLVANLFGVQLPLSLITDYFSKDIGGSLCGQRTQCLRR